MPIDEHGRLAGWRRRLRFEQLELRAAPGGFLAGAGLLGPGLAEVFGAYAGTMAPAVEKQETTPGISAPAVRQSRRDGPTWASFSETRDHDVADLLSAASSQRAIPTTGRQPAATTSHASHSLSDTAEVFSTLAIALNPLAVFDAHSTEPDPPIQQTTAPPDSGSSVPPCGCGGGERSEGGEAAGSATHAAAGGTSINANAAPATLAGAAAATSASRLGAGHRRRPSRQLQCRGTCACRD